MLKFLQRAPKSAAVPVAAVPAIDTDATTAVSTTSQDDAAAVPSVTCEAITLPEIKPLPGVIGMEAARLALQFIGRSKPRAMIFVASPRTSAHAACLQTLITDEARTLATVDAVVVVTDFTDPHTLTVLRLPRAQATALANGVADAIEMLSVTLPAAFDSDSYTVARASLDEELRSGHDTAIDTLKRRALASNIGLLRTPLGYAVAPMHEGRVVAPDVFKALPERLKADVEAKLTAFETELSGVLENRALLQQDYRSRLRELDLEVAGLGVRAALSGLAANIAATSAVTAFLDALTHDLTRNAALFMTAARHAHATPRAPIEIANDATLARYRVAVLGPPSASPGLEIPDGLERADLFGASRAATPGRPPNPADLSAGVLTRAGSGCVVVDARELLAQYSCWPLLRQAFRTGSAVPADGASATGRAMGLALPVDARLILVGDVSDYVALCNIDPDASRAVHLIEAFTATVPLTPAMERAFAGHVAALILEDGLQPIDDAGLAVLKGDRTVSKAGAPLLSTDLDVVRDVLARATLVATADDREVTSAADILVALKARAETQARLFPELETTAAGAAHR